MATGEKLFKNLAVGQRLVASGFVGLLTLVGGASWYGYTRLESLSTQITALNSELASTTAILQDANTSLGNAILQERQNVQVQLGGVKDQVGSISGTVTDLQKLSKIDPELLKKYSKVFFLSENYVPAGLVTIPPEDLYNETKKQQVISQVLPFLEHLITDAKDDGVPLYVQSAYRSFATQESLKNQYTFTYGAGTANQFSADQGYSEHQLGTTIDLITKGTGGQLPGFDRTPAFTWMKAHAYRYGFILSYPQGNGYYEYEPWHWRFVGVKLATDLHATDSNFYDMDQRTIDTYLISLFNN